MKLERRLIPLLLIAMYGVVYAFYFLTTFVSSVLSGANPTWDPLPFIPGLANVDNLYLVFGTFVVLIFILLCSPYVAGFLMWLHRILESPRTLRLEEIEPKRSFTQLFRRAIIPAMFSFSIGEVIIVYLKELSAGLFVAPNLGQIPIGERLALFVAKTFHLSFLFLPITLAIFIPTWIFNDYVIASHRKYVGEGEYSDPIKVGRWVSGLLGGFSMFAFPLTFLNAFLFTPLENLGPGEVASTLPLILLIMTNVMIVLIAYVFLIIFLYEFGKSRIGERFSKVAKWLNVENVPDDLSLPGDSPVPMIQGEE